MSALLAVWAAGCGTGHRQEDPLAARFELPAGAVRLEVSVPSGPLSFTAGAAGEVVLDGATRRWAASAEHFRSVQELDFVPALEPVAGEEGAFRLAFPGLPDGLGERDAALIVKARIALPPRVALAARTARGDLTVVDRRAAVHLRTGSGSILCEDVHGALDAETGHGELVVVGHRGDLRAVSGGRTLFADIEELGPGGASLVTQEPSMIVRIAPGIGFDLDARVRRSTAGKVGVRTAFDVPVRAAGRGHRAVGPVRGGGPPVELEVGRGYLSLDRLHDEAR